MAHPPADQTRPDGTRGIVLRSVQFDTGSTFATGQGETSRNVWDTDLMNAELDLVVELNANSVNLYGSDLGRLSAAAESAVERGLHVRLDPRLPDRSQEQVVDFVAELAGLAESLRKQGAPIDFTVGATHTIFTPGIFPGEPYLERLANIYFDGDQRFGVREPKTADQWLTENVTGMLTESAPKLNAYLDRLVRVTRGIYHGRLSYTAAPWEQVDWTPFDAVSVVHYLFPAHMTVEQHLSELGRYTRHGKPVFVSGFGTASYQGAEEKGFFNWDIVDRSTPNLTILDGHERDEGAQAEYYGKMLEIFDRAGVYGVAPADLVHPTHPHHETDVRHDLDMASMCIVRSVRTDFADPNSQYRRTPKKSFHAVAAYYARVRDRAAVPA
ncbi:abortive infection protein [Dactylosporangium sp. McL0621]|uniref:abortive infection protein n=1 Tax=Dactylosporangium sp. McL0621 TaxID=3415678 RepID=UPI003CF6E3EE